jgi:hypothetical protein
MLFSLVSLIVVVSFAAILPPKVARLRAAISACVQAARRALAERLVPGCTAPAQTVTATVMPAPSHTADILRLVKAAELRLEDDPAGVIFQTRGRRPVFALSNTGEYFLYSPRTGRWTSASEARILVRLQDIVIWAAPAAPTNVLVDPYNP